MGIHRLVVWLAAGSLSACVPVKSFHGADPRVAGVVHGLWMGADGVALRLQAGSVSSLLTLPSDGSFRFDHQLAPGTSYSVSVANDPAYHTCLVTDGGEGVIADTDVSDVVIACTGPSVVISTSARWTWAFDPTEEVQVLMGSVVAQGVALTVAGATMQSARVNGAEVTLGEPTSPFALSLGTTEISVALTAAGGLSKIYRLVFDRGHSLLDHVMYGKASNTGAGDQFGNTVALFGDTLVVGAPQESSAAVGVNGDSTGDPATSSGAAYVFVRDGGTWIQQAYLKASNTDAEDQFGTSVTLSADTLVVGAPQESSAATGVNGDETDNTASSSGAAYVFVRTNGTWVQQAYLKASNTGEDDLFGSSVSLSGDTLAVAAKRESSSAVGVNGNQHDDSAPGSGAVYIFVRTGIEWKQQAYVKASNTDAGDLFGIAISLSGNTLAVGAQLESSASTGINEDDQDNSATGSGAVYVFVRARTTWAQEAYIKASNAEVADLFGGAVSLSGDTLAVGAIGESSALTGIDRDGRNNGAKHSGAAYIFARSGTTWTQQAYIKASNTRANAWFGSSVALTGDLLAVGSRGESSASTAIDGDQESEKAGFSGAVYMFSRNDTTWTQRAYVKATNTAAFAAFGASAALSEDTLVVGATGESSAAVGIGGDQTDHSAESSGAVYVIQ